MSVSKRLDDILRSLRSAWVATRQHLASGRSSQNVLERFGVVPVRLGRHEGTLGLGAVVPERFGAFWSRGGPLGSSRGNNWPLGRSSRSVLERLDGILKRGGPLGSPRRNTWLRGRASRSVLERLDCIFARGGPGTGEATRAQLPSSPAAQQPSCPAAQQPSSPAAQQPSI